VATSGAPENYGVVLDAFSLHYLRSTPDDFSGDGTLLCTDSLAIGQRVLDVFDWVGITSPATCSPMSLIIGVDDGVASGPAVMRTALHRSSPNPFNPRTTVRYQLGERTHTRLEVFDVSGRLVRALVDEIQGPDRYSVPWDGRADDGQNAGSGVYWVRLKTASGFDGSTKLVIVR
jgi:hypothetical protein